MRVSATILGIGGIWYVTSCKNSKAIISSDANFLRAAKKARDLGYNVGVNYHYMSPPVPRDAVRVTSNGYVLPATSAAPPARTRSKKKP